MKKNRPEKVRKHIFYKQTNIVTKKLGEKYREKFFFQKHTYIASYKRWKKIVWKKCENTFFINTLIMCPKMGEKNREKNFSRNTDFASKQRWKKSSGKSAKTRFL